MVRSYTYYYMVVHNYLSPCGILMWSKVYSYPPNNPLLKLHSNDYSYFVKNISKGDLFKILGDVL